MPTTTTTTTTTTTGGTTTTTTTTASTPDAASASAAAAPAPPAAASAEKRIVLVAGGSRGDTQPVVALGLRLQKAGYKITLIAAENEGEFAEAYGMDFVAMTNMKKIIKEDGYLENVEKDAQGDVFAWLVERIPDINANDCPLIAEACFQPGVVAMACSSTHALFALALGKKLNIPVAITLFQPWIKNKEFLPSCAPVETQKECKPEDYGAQWDGILGMLQGMWDAAAPDLTKEFGFDSDDDWMTPDNVTTSFCGELPGVLTLNCFPPTLVGLEKMKPDLSEKAYASVCGPLVLPKKESILYQAPADLQAFISAGDAPVYMGWGSMLRKNTAELTRVVIKASMIMKKRAVVLAGWAELSIDLLDATADAELIEHAKTNVFFTQNVSHQWLLPQCCAVVHHGGAGTTVASLMSGAPTIISPVAFDQYWHGGRIEAIGCGLRISSIAMVTADELAQAVITCTTDPSIVSTAKEVALKIQGENGTAEAAYQFLALMSSWKY